VSAGRPGSRWSGCCATGLDRPDQVAAARGRAASTWRRWRCVFFINRHRRAPRRGWVLAMPGVDDGPGRAGAGCDCCRTLPEGSRGGGGVGKPRRAVAAGHPIPTADRPTAKWLPAALGTISSKAQLPERRSDRAAGLRRAVAEEGRDRAWSGPSAPPRSAARGLRTRDASRVASHAKTFTAAGHLEAARGGELSLDDRGRHVEEAGPRHTAEPPPAQLLSHKRRRVTRESDDTGQWSGPPAGPGTSASCAPPWPGRRNRGQHRCKYSNHGFGLLGWGSRR